MADAMTVVFDSSGLDDDLDAIAGEARSAVRPAAQAAAQVYYDEVRQRAPIAKRARTTKSGRVIAPGALKASIYQVYSEDNSTPDRATYHVSWNARKAPHGHLVEFGTSRAPAHPFLRPAFDSANERAIRAADAVLAKTLIDGKP